MIQGEFPLWLLTLILGLFLATIMFCTTKNDFPPTYHSVCITLIMYEMVLVLFFTVHLVLHHNTFLERESILGR